MRVLYLSHCRASKAQASLCKCTGSPEPSLLAYTKYGCRLRHIPKFTPLVPLNTSAWAFQTIGGFCGCETMILILYIYTCKTLPFTIIFTVYKRETYSRKQFSLSLSLSLSLYVSLNVRVFSVQFKLIFLYCFLLPFLLKICFSLSDLFNTYQFSLNKPATMNIFRVFFLFSF